MGNSGVEKFFMELAILATTTSKDFHKNPTHFRINLFLGLDIATMTTASCFKSFLRKYHLFLYVQSDFYPGNKENQCLVV